MDFTCASRPLVSPDVRIVVGVGLAVFRGSDVQVAVPLDGNLMTIERCHVGQLMFD